MAPAVFGQFGQTGRLPHRPLNGSGSDLHRLAALHGLRLFMAQDDRVASQVARQNRRGSAALQRLGHFLDLEFEGLQHRIAIGQLGMLDLSLGVEQRERRDLQFAAGQNRQIEVQRRSFKVQLKAVREGAALLVQDAAGRRDHKRRIGKPELARALLNHFAPHPTLTGDGRRHAEQEANEMRIVNMQIDERPADGARVVEILDPERIGDHPFEVTP